MSVIRWGLILICLMTVTGCRSMSNVFGQAACDESTAEMPSINDIGKNAD